MNCRDLKLKLVKNNKWSKSLSLFQTAFQNQDFTDKDFFSILEQYKKSSSNIIFYANQHPLTTLEKDELLQNDDEVTSIKIKSADIFSTKLKHLRESLQNTFECGISINAYYSKKGESCLLRHFDLYDILIISISGKKEWSLGNQDKLIGSDKKYNLSQENSLFIPKLTPHHVKTLSKEGAIHLSIGFHPITSQDVLRDLLKDFYQDMNLESSDLAEPDLNIIKSEAQKALLKLTKDINSNLEESIAKTKKRIISK